jgi:hypothetical protein
VDARRTLYGKQEGEDPAILKKVGYEMLKTDVSRKPKDKVHQ